MNTLLNGERLILNEYQLRLLKKLFPFCGSSRVYFYGIDQVTLKHIIHENDNQMNTKLNLIEKLKNVPAGTEFYSTIFEEVKFEGLCLNGLEDERIKFRTRRGLPHATTKEGHLYKGYPNAECIVFPSKDQRDWSKFEYDPIAIGTPVMVKGPGNWILRFYAGQGECCKHQGYFSEALIKLGTFKGEEIIPVSEFDFEKLCRKGEVK